MPIWEPPPGPPTTQRIAFSLAAVVGVGAHLLAGYVWFIGLISLVPDRPEDQGLLDLVRFGLAAAWVTLGGAFLIGWSFFKRWTLLLPFVTLALTWFGLQIVPAHVGLGHPGPSS